MALELICKIMQPQDAIEIIVCEQANLDTQHVISKSLRKLEELDAHENVKVEILNSHPGKKSCDIIRDALMSWTDQKYIDFIYVGNKGADFSSRTDKDYLGSVTNEIIRHTKLNVFFMP